MHTSPYSLLYVPGPERWRVCRDGVPFRAFRSLSEACAYLDLVESVGPAPRPRAAHPAAARIACLGLLALAALAAAAWVLACVGVSRAAPAPPPRVSSAREQARSEAAEEAEPDPLAGELAQFPPDFVVADCLAFAEAHGRWLASRTPYGWLDYEVLTAWRAEHAHCLGCWRDLDHARDRDALECTRRERLGSLRGRLGEADYWAGRMPAAAPFGRFTRAD
jgi:hypothetical protein